MPPSISLKNTMISIAELEKLAGSPFSAVTKVKKPFHVALHSRYSTKEHLNLGLIRYFNTLVGHYCSEVDGIILGYGKIFLKDSMGTFVNDDAMLHLDVLGTFWIFQPRVDQVLEGLIYKKGHAHVSCIVNLQFNVPCHKPTDIPEKDWIGRKVKLYQRVKMTVTRVDMSQEVPIIDAELDEDSVHENIIENNNEFLVEAVGNAVFEDKCEELKDATAKKKKRKREGNGSDSTLLQSPKSKRIKFSDNDSGMETLVENSKKEQEMDEISDKSNSPAKKKKKKKKKSRNSDDEEEYDDTRLTSGLEETRVAEEDAAVEPEDTRKKKKKKKKKNRNSDDEQEKHDTRLTSGLEEMGVAEEKVVVESGDTRKKKKKKNKNHEEDNRHEARLIQDLEETRVDETEDARKKKKKKKSKEKLQNEDEMRKRKEEEDRVQKEKLQSSLLDSVLSKFKKK